MWRTFVWKYCTNCQEDGHPAESCTSAHVHGWRLRTVADTLYHCQGCDLQVPVAWVVRRPA